MLQIAVNAVEDFISIHLHSTGLGMITYNILTFCDIKAL